MILIQQTRDPAPTDIPDVATIYGTIPASEITYGSLWRNTVTGSLFACVDPVAGTWVQISLPLADQRHQLTNVQAAGTTLAPTAAQSGTRFILTNAAAVAVTLPAVAEGLVFEFLRAADEEMAIASAEGDNMIVGNDTEADSITFTTPGEHIGALVRAEGILVGTTAKWLITVPHVPIGTGTAFPTYASAT